MNNASDSMEPLPLQHYRERLNGPAGDTPLSGAEARELFQAYEKLHLRLTRIACISDHYQSEVKDLVMELQDALASVKTLKGLIPICASCKKIRNDDGYWKQIEQYLVEHSDMIFSHGLCPECAKKYNQSLAANKGRKPVPVTMPEPQPDWTIDETDIDDPFLVDLLPVVNNTHFHSSPLYGEFSQLLQKYMRQVRRMKRIARISDSYQAQQTHLRESLRQCEQRSQALLEAIPAALLLVGDDGAIAGANQRFDQTFGLAPDERPTLDALWQRACPDAANNERAAAWQAALDPATTIEPIPCRLIGRDGQPHLFQLAATRAGQEWLVTFATI